MISISKHCLGLVPDCGILILSRKVDNGFVSILSWNSRQDQDHIETCLESCGSPSGDRESNSTGVSDGVRDGQH